MQQQVETQKPTSLTSLQDGHRLENLEVMRMILRESKDPEMREMMKMFFSDELIRNSMARIADKGAGYARAPSVKRIHKAANYVRICHGATREEKEVLACATVLYGVMRFWIYAQGWQAFNAHEEMRGCIRLVAKRQGEAVRDKFQLLRLALGLDSEEGQRCATGLRLQKAVNSAWAWVSLGVAVE